ncbi:hypothetical protein [Georgenia yuyongxinii]|uniref:Uncharacterized protein n=1 Tax=Georgenia yuyongxinii TaxID=2589797 RepID=A0A552WR75_9MICO|nr:hypothetical protein [Georgenia yuyongxinii]TRW45311.1 hypothetical protein FJ693_10025 [Georgenia yuyongxinii]
MNTDGDSASRGERVSDRTVSPRVSFGAQWAMGFLGVVVLIVGAIAVFTTDNGPGAAALVAAGLAASVLGVFANRISSFEGAGVKLELATAVALEEAAQRLEVAGHSDAADRIRDEAQALMARADPLVARYATARSAQNPRSHRIAEQERIVRGWVEFARAQKPDGNFVRQLFASDDPSKRIGAIAMMTEAPSLTDPSLLAAALREPASAFEQYHALQAIEALVIHRGSEQATRELVELVGRELAAGHFGAERSDRCNLAEHILAMLPTEAT